MKWVLSHATDGFHHWQLQQENQAKLLIFHLSRLSLRLTGIIKRLFFLQEQGFLQKKVLLRSEYGIVLGEATPTDKSSPGQLLLNGQKFFYRTESTQLILLDNDKQLVGACELPAEAPANRLERFGLLFSFAWFLTADAAADKDRALSVTA
jgi:hypothetical protein